MHYKCFQYDPKALLFDAVEKGNYSLVQYLWEEEGFSTSNKIKNEPHDGFGEWTVLHSACEKGNLKIVEFLLIKNGTDLQVGDLYGNTPLHIACNKGYGAMELAKLLIKNGANLFAKNLRGRTPFYWASQEGTLEIKKLLFLENGAPVDPENQKLRTKLLKLACESCHFEVAALLVKNGANVNVLTKYGQTPLHHTSWWGQLKLSSLLIKFGADVDAQDNDGRTPIHTSYYQRYCELQSIELLINHGASVNVQDNDGKTLLHELCGDGHGRLVAAELMIENLANPNLKEDKYGKTPFFLACETGLLEEANLLMMFGAYLNTQDNNGDTPLHASLKNRHLEIAKLLIENAADLNVKNNAGQTPLSLAYDGDYLEEIVELLLSRGAIVTMEE